ncbi:MAG: pyridoxamine 5-phosphate oxidase [Jatrophihabitantaceae bacterium]|nr:pyridoxamine 5-phosphate oxidase [Jatrophihabitantaceae bacterium]
MTREPSSTRIDPRFGAPAAEALQWAVAADALARAGTYFLVTVRADGTPHATTVLAVQHDGAMHICTGVREQKYVNLQAHPRCSLLAGNGAMDTGVDLALEATARRVGDDATLAALVEAWVAKYGEIWRFEIVDGAFDGGGGRAEVFRLEPVRAFGFAKDIAGQTTWDFAD